MRSSDTAAELTDVILRPKFDPYLPLIKRRLFLATFSEETEYVLVTDRITACRDPRDNKFLELAVAGKADIILSGDDDLLALDPFQDIRILSPAEFISD